MSGISAQYADGLEFRIKELGEQIEKLTEAYDQPGRTVQDYGRIINQTELRLHEVSTHCANVEQELAVLAEQNEKMREALEVVHAQLVDGKIFTQQVHRRPYWRYSVSEALALPNLATPVLNRIKAEGMRDAAMHCSKHGSRTADGARSPRECTPRRRTWPLCSSF